jgi:plasmid stability protein
MPVTLSIDVPDDLAHKLRLRAERNHRSLQDELIAIIEDAVQSDKPLTAKELLAKVRRLGLRTPSDSASIIRQDRDRR